MLLFNTAPNTWRMRNAFRKFHAYRELMFENAGVSKEERGRYGHTMRPYLNAGHKAEELLFDADPDTGDIFRPVLGLKISPTGNLHRALSMFRVLCS